MLLICTKSALRYMDQGYTMLLHRQLDDRQLEVRNLYEICYCI